MTQQTVTRFLRRACQRCGGDAFLDLSDDPAWRCLQCGRVVTTAAAPASDGQSLVVRPAA
jgi:hypothetical protein